MNHVQDLGAPDLLSVLVLYFFFVVVVFVFVLFFKGNGHKLYALT